MLRHRGGCCETIQTLKENVLKCSSTTLPQSIMAVNYVEYLWQSTTLKPNSAIRRTKRQRILEKKHDFCTGRWELYRVGKTPLFICHWGERVLWATEQKYVLCVCVCVCVVSCHFDLTVLSLCVSGLNSAHQPLLQHCSQSCRISGHSCKTPDTTCCTILSRLSVSKRMTSAANICLTPHAELSRNLKTPRAIKTTISCASGDTDLCSIQQVNKCIIAPGLLAHHSLKAVAPARKMHLLPQGSTINPNSTHTLTLWIHWTKRKHNGSQVVKPCVFGVNYITHQCRTNKCGSTLHPPLCVQHTTTCTHLEVLRRLESSP